MDQVNAIDSFKEAAEAASAKYLANVRLMTTQLGARPHFDDLMAQLKLLERELTGHGVKFIETNKNGHQSKDAMTDDLKTIIHSTIENFVRQL